MYRKLLINGWHVSVTLPPIEARYHRAGVIAVELENPNKDWFIGFHLFMRRAHWFIGRDEPYMGVWQGFGVGPLCAVFWGEQ